MSRSRRERIHSRERRKGSRNKSNVKAKGKLGAERHGRKVDKTSS